MLMLSVAMKLALASASGLPNVPLDNVQIIFCTKS